MAVSLPFIFYSHSPFKSNMLKGAFVSHAETVCVDRCIQSYFSLLTHVEFCTYTNVPIEWSSSTSVTFVSDG